MLVLCIKKSVNGINVMQKKIFVLLSLEDDISLCSNKGNISVSLFNSQKSNKSSIENKSPKNLIKVNRSNGRLVLHVFTILIVILDKLQ